MFCLDTNAVIALIGHHPSANARFRRELARNSRMAAPVIVLHELRFGIAKSTRRAHNERMLTQFFVAPIETLAFDAEDAAEAADIRMHLQTKGTPIGPYDLLIAAQARRRGATLVTGNVREFRRVPRLAVEDWTRP